MTTLRMALYTTCAIASLCAAPSAIAQDAAASGAAAPAAESPSLSGGDIIVTAQKRAENVQDIPKGVTVVSKAALDAQGVTTSRELANAVPSVTLSDNSMNSKPPGIRGIVTFSTGVGVQTQTGIVVDDIAQPTFSTLYTELSDIDRVEVFAGPQSTLSGRNAVGGLINFVTRTPSSTPEANVNLEQTTDGQTRASVFLTGPLANDVDFSLSAYYNKWRGSTRNLFFASKNEGTYTDGFENLGIRGKIRADLSDRLTATFTGYYLESERIPGPAIYIQVDPGSTAWLDTRIPKRTFAELFPGVVARPGNRDGYSEENSLARTKDRGASLRLDYDIDSIGSISSLTNYQKSNQPRKDVWLGSPRTDIVPFITGFLAITDVSTKYFSQEVRLTSPSGKSLTYLAGAIYSASDLFQPYDRSKIFSFNSDRTFGIKSLGIFGRGTYHASPSDDVVLGARYQHDTIDYTWKFYLGPPGAYSENENKYGFFAGEASYTHRFSDDINTYVTVSRSETGKSFDTEDNTAAALGPLQPFQSEKVQSYQVGLKSRFFDKKLTLNVEVYRANYKHYQVQSLLPGGADTAPNIKLRSVGAVRIQGVDVTLSARPSPNLTLSLLANYNEAEIRDYPGAPCYFGQTEALGCKPATPTSTANQGNLRGYFLQNAPKLKFNANVDYSPAFLPEALGVILGLSYRFQSKENFDITQDPVAVQDSFGILNGRISISPNDRYQLTFYVNNIFDKNYYSSLGHDFLISGLRVSYGRDSFRYGGVRLNVKF